MNLASWIILGVVIVIVGLAVKATFFSKKPHGSCCDAGDADASVAKDAQQRACSSQAACAGCSGCSECSLAVTQNALQPLIKELNEK